MATKMQLDFLRAFSPVIYGYGYGVDTSGYLAGRALRVLGAYRPTAKDHEAIMEAVSANITLGDSSKAKLLNTPEDRGEFISKLYEGFDMGMTWHELDDLRAAWKVPPYFKGGR